MSKFIHPYRSISDNLMEVLCQKCGYCYQTYKRYLSEDRKEIWWLCKSCKYKPTTHVRYPNGEVCFPHQGDFDIDLLICLDKDGNPYKLGKRTCGHADCVNSKHIIETPESIG